MKSPVLLHEFKIWDHESVFLSLSYVDFVCIFYFRVTLSLNQG